MQDSPKETNNTTTRRTFLGTSAAAVGASLIVDHALSGAVYAAENNTLKVGLIGAGGRGGGAAVNALTADPNTEIVAIGDAFPDHAETKLGDLQLNEEVGDRINVPAGNVFSGYDAYKGVIEASDVVILATPPHFRPLHLRAAVEAGKHVFCEKPVAVDPPGVRSVMETCKLAAEKGVSVVSGLCYRYDLPKQETVKRIHDGAVGDIRFLQTNYLTTGTWIKPRQEGWGDQEYMVRNWLYYTWLSGDHIVEQHVHSLDKMLWVMKDVPPVRVLSTGGRIQRTQPQYGNIYDHFANVFEWENGIRCVAQCRQFNNSFSDTSDWVFGTKGTAEISNAEIKGENGWRYAMPRDRKLRPKDKYVAEHIALFTNLRKGTPINNGDYMCKATMMGIMARESAYTGQPVTWDDIMKSNLRLGPEKYDMKADMPEAKVIVPGSKQPRLL